MSGSNFMSIHQAAVEIFVWIFVFLKSFIEAQWLQIDTFIEMEVFETDDLKHSRQQTACIHIPRSCVQIE